MHTTFTYSFLYMTNINIFKEYFLKVLFHLEHQNSGVQLNLLIAPVIYTTNYIHYSKTFVRLDLTYVWRNGTKTRK